MIRRFISGRAGILPRDGGGEPWLAAVIAVLCFLACLSAVGAAAADRAAHGWARQLRAVFSPVWERARPCSEFRALGI